MKGKSFFNFALAISLSLCAFSSSSIAANPNARPVIIDRSELDAVLSAPAFSSGIPVVIEFYDSKDPDTSGECARQIAAFHNAQQRFAGKVTMLRADAQSQNANMIARERIAVCRTHVFVLDNNGQRLIGKRIFGFLNEKQFAELFDEFYQIKP
jgi:hypothetical protein